MQGLYWEINIFAIITFKPNFMKITKLISIMLLIAIMASCSSGGSGNGSSTTTNLTLNGANVVVSGAMAQRGDDTFVISANLPNSESIQLEFNKYGNLAEFSYWTNTNVYKNFQYYKTNYFTFSLISLNESAHTVKVSYSGTLYADENDMTSATKQVSGTFDLPYTVTSPLLTGLGLNCKIAGSSWYETQFWDNGFGGAVDRKYINDDDKMIIMRFGDQTISPGTYTFNTASSNKVQMAKYNTTTHTYTEYNAVGTLTITSNSAPISIRIIEGTFSFNAINPSNSADEVQVTNGRFKTNF